MMNDNFEFLEVEIANLQESVQVDENLLHKVVLFVLKEELVPEAEISVALLSENEMKRLNWDYRGINEATDVLSFLLDERPLVGEIILSPSYVKKQAENNEVLFEKEIVSLSIHGLMHLLGYDHEGKEEEADLMWKRQRELEEKFWALENIS